MKPRLFSLYLLIVLSPIVAAGAEFRLLHRSDPPRPAKWRAADATWVDDDRLLICPTSKSVSCVEKATGKLVWTRELDGTDKRIAYSRGAKRIARFSGYSDLAVLDVESGETLFEADKKRWEELLGKKYAWPSKAAMHPVDGRLLVVAPDLAYGENAYLLGASLDRVEARFGIDALPDEVSFSANGKRLAVLAHNDVRCVTDLESEKDVYFVGTRTLEKPDGLTFVIDAPFCSALQHDGEDLIVYAIDNSWARGRIYVHRISSGEALQFDSRNGHVVLDVDWEGKRIALGGASENLTLLDFDGNELAELKKAVASRIMSVEFSPSKREVLVTGQDNVAAIFEIVD